VQPNHDSGRQKDIFHPLRELCEELDVDFCYEFPFSTSMPSPCEACEGKCTIYSDDVYELLDHMGVVL
jgi:hypothetical protein